MSTRELREACQQLHDDVLRMFPETVSAKIERPKLTLIQGGASRDVSPPVEETNEERSARLGFTYTDEHRQVEETLTQIETRLSRLRQPPTLEVIDGGGDDVAS
jgi:hypothetical protein